MYVTDKCCLFLRSHRYDKRPADSNLLEGTLVGRSRHLARDRLHSSELNVISRSRPRSLERSTNDLLEHDLQLRRLQAMRSPPPTNVLSRLGNPAGKFVFIFFKIIVGSWQDFLGAASLPRALLVELVSES